MRNIIAIAVLATIGFSANAYSQTTSTIPTDCKIVVTNGNRSVVCNDPVTAPAPAPAPAPSTTPPV